MRQERFGCRPRLSLAPESFAPSAARPANAAADTFQTVEARAVLGPERFRGRLLLRRWLCHALPRRHPGARAPGDAACLGL